MTIIKKIFHSFFFLIFAAIGLLFFLGFMWISCYSIATYAWLQTPCKIISSEVVLDKMRPGEEEYLFKVQYRYLAQGKEFVSSKYAFNTPDRGLSLENYSYAIKLSQAYPRDLNGTCFVNPFNPRDAILKRGGFSWAIIFTPIPLIFILVGAGGIYSAWNEGKNPKQPLAVKKSSPIIRSAAKKGLEGRLKLIIFAVFLLFGLLVLYFSFIRPFIKFSEAKGWQSLPCSIISSHVRSHHAHHGDDTTTYSIDILYAYAVNSREYKSSSYGFFNGSSSGYKQKYAVVSQYPPGSQKVCYVNPQNPQEAVLERRITLDIWIPGFISLMFVLFGLAGVLGEWGAFCDSKAKELIPGLKRLKSEQGPVKNFLGALLFTVFWNGIIIAIALAEKGTANNCTDALKFLFSFPLIIFSLIGIFVFVLLGYYFLTLFNPRVEISLNSKKVCLGEKIDFEWRISRNIQSFQRFRIYLEGREEASWHHGKNSGTLEEVFYSQDIVDLSAPIGTSSGYGTVNIPADTMPSFVSDNNEIIWSIKIDGIISRWPDVEEEFKIKILPFKKV